MNTRVFCIYNNISETRARIWALTLFADKYSIIILLIVHKFSTATPHHFHIYVRNISKCTTREIMLDNRQQFEQYRTKRNMTLTHIHIVLYVSENSEETNNFAGWCVRACYLTVSVRSTHQWVNELSVSWPQKFNSKLFNNLSMSVHILVPPNPHSPTFRTPKCVYACVRMLSAWESV